jgi:hypothetical protein
VLPASIRKAISSLKRRKASIRLHDATIQKIAVLTFRYILQHSLSNYISLQCMLKYKFCSNVHKLLVTYYLKFAPATASISKTYILWQCFKANSVCDTCLCVRRDKIHDVLFKTFRAKKINQLLLISKKLTNNVADVVTTYLGPDVDCWPPVGQLCLQINQDHFLPCHFQFIIH